MRASMALHHLAITFSALRACGGDDVARIDIGCSLRRAVRVLTLNLCLPDRPVSYEGMDRSKVVGGTGFEPVTPSV